MGLVHEGAEFAKKGAAIVTMGAVALGAYEFRGDIGKAMRCLGDLRGCIVGGAHIPEVGQGASAKFGNLDVQSQELSGTASNITFGDVSERIGGTPSKLDYHASWLQGLEYLWVVDGTVFWNESGQGSTEMLYEPCLRLSNDYRKAAAPASVDSNGNTAHDTTGKNFNAPISYSTSTYTSGPLKGDIAVNIDAHTLDACYMRPALSQDNTKMIGANNSTQRNIPKAYINTFTYMMDKVLTDYALSQSCPEEVSQIPAIKDEVKKIVLGAMEAKYTDASTVNAIKAAYDGGRFYVKIDSPAARQQYYRNQLHNDITSFSQRTKTFPEMDGGKTHDMDRPKFGNFQQYSCSAAGMVQQPGGGNSQG